VFKPDFQFEPVKGSFNKKKCNICGEYVFERYLRMKDGNPVCIPCSGKFYSNRTGVSAESGQAQSPLFPGSVI
jgi:hypothetical protein